MPQGNFRQGILRKSSEIHQTEAEEEKVGYTGGGPDVGTSIIVFRGDFVWRSVT